MASREHVVRPFLPRWTQSTPLELQTRNAIENKLHLFKTIQQQGCA